MPRFLPPLLVLSSMINLAARGDEGEWTRFRGPNGSGISAARTLPANWTENDYNWKIELPGKGHSSPVVWGQRVFVTCGDPGTARRTILCLDATSGRTLWRRDYPSAPFPQHRDNTYATATPAVDAQGVVVTWTTPEAVVLLALDTDGREQWRRDLGPFVGVQGSGSSPILFDALAVLQNDQEDPSLIPGHKKDPPEPVGKSSLLAVDRRTGQTRWQVERTTSFSAYSTPCVYRFENGRSELIFTTTAHGITAVDPATGKINWELNEKCTDRCISSPVAAPGMVLMGHGAGLRGLRCLAVRPPEAGQKPAVVYELTQSLPLVPTPLVKDDRLYLWSDNGVVSCLKLASGEVVWQERVDGAFFASPVWAAGRLYCISKKGEVVVVAAADQFQILARVPLGESSFATPAIAGGVMYLRTATHLFSLGGSK